MVQQIPVQFTAVENGFVLRIETVQRIDAYDAYFLECAILTRAPLLILIKKMKLFAGESGIQLLE